MTRIPTLLAATSLIASMSGCEDPSLAAAIDSLGPEQDGFEEEETHRVGQPCTYCHRDGGPGEPTMSIGGTLFHRPVTGEPFAVAGFVVELVDADGQRATTTSNRCGNFYLSRGRFDPVFPVLTRILNRDGTEIVTMRSRIASEGSCGACHTEPRGPLSAGVIDVPGDDTWFSPPRQGSCPDPRFLDNAELPPDLR